jgi:hypothetical protein
MCNQQPHKINPPRQSTLAIFHKLSILGYQSTAITYDLCASEIISSATPNFIS